MSNRPTRALAVGQGDRLNPASFIPLYVQLTEILQERIERRTFPPGSRFASESELSNEFGVSRAVVRPALTILENNGLITRVKGKGTFVAPAKSMDRVRGLVRDLATRPVRRREVEVTDVSEESADRELRSVLDLSSKRERILHAASLIQIDARVIGFRDSFVSLTRVPEIEGLVRPGRLVGDPHLSMESSRTDTLIETSYCTPFESALFKVSPGSPTLLVRCIEYRPNSSGDEAVEMARMVYRADIVTLEAGTSST